MDLPLNGEILRFKSFKERIRTVKYLEENLHGLRIKIIDGRTIQVLK